MDIGAKIRNIRKSKGLTQIEVADRAQIAVNSLRNYEANKRQPNMEQLRAIANALEISLSDLIWQGEGPAKEPLHGMATPHGAYIVSDPESKEPFISDKDIRFAFFGGAEEITDEDIEDVRKYAEYILARKKKNPPQD